VLNRAYLGHRYVEVFNALPSEVSPPGRAPAARSRHCDRRPRVPPPPFTPHATRRAPRRPPQFDAAAAGAIDYDAAQPGGRRRRGSCAGGGSVLSDGTRSPSVQSLSPRSAHGRPADAPPPPPPPRPVVKLAGVPPGVTPRALADWLVPAECLGGTRGLNFCVDLVRGRG
jgi:hypothetical protein